MSGEYSEPSSDPMETVRYLSILKHGWRLIVAGAGVALAVATLIVVAIRLTAPDPDPRYTATATVFFEVEDLIDSTTVAAFVTSDEVARAAAQLLDSSNPENLLDHVSAAPSETPNVIDITAEASSAKTAEDIADAFAESFVEIEPSLPAVEPQTSQGPKHRLAAVKREIDRLTASVRKVENKIASQIAVARTQTQLARLQALLSLETSIKRARVLELQQRQLRLQNALGISNEGEQPQPAHLEILSRATASADVLPQRSAVVPIVAVTIFGLLAGAVLVLLMEFFERRIHTEADAATAFGYPVVGVIPPLSLDQPHDFLDAVRRNKDFATAVRLALIGVLKEASQRAGGRSPVLLVTSAEAGEQKTATAATFALVLAEWGKRAAFMSADFINRDAHDHFSIAEGPGLAEVATGVSRLDDVLHEGSVEGLSIVMAGTPKGSPAAMFGSQAIDGVVTELRNQADVVVMDTSSVADVAEVGLIFGEVDAVVVLAVQGKTKLRVANRVGEMLRRTQAPVAGIIVVDAFRRRASR